MHGPGGEEDREHDDQQEPLAVALPREPLKGERRDVAAEPDHEREHAGGQGQPLRDRQAGGEGVAPGEQRHQRHDRHDRQILHQQHREGRGAVAAGDFAAIPEQLHHERRRGEREGQADDQGRLPRLLPQQGVRGDGGPGERDLQRPDAEDLPPHGREPGGLQLEPDHEEQQDHAEFGETAEVLDVVREGRAGGMRADDHAGDEQADHRAEAEALREGDRHRGDEQQEDGRDDEALGCHDRFHPTPRRCREERALRRML